jgi:hypothetical protein
MKRPRRRARCESIRALAWPLALTLGTVLSALPCAAPAAARDEAYPIAMAPPTYADLVDLSEAATVVARLTVKDQATVPPERAPGLAPGHARLYLETETERVLKGPDALGESVSYLVDVPLDAKGKPPKLKKQTVLVFARTVPDHPGELQLVEPDAQLPGDTTTESRVRAVIAELVAPDAPPRITGVRDVISVAGNLAGESETQMFVETESGMPVSLTVIRRPSMAPTWGVSWSEIVDQAARPPEGGTLAWYRLACFLPRRLSNDAFLQADSAGRERARADYQFILDSLGPCERTRH